MVNGQAELSATSRFDARARKRLLIKLGIISIGLDLLTSAFEIPFIFALFGAISLEEMCELFVSSLIARNDLRLDWLDRLIGFLPVPGVTAVTVAILREWKFGKK